jgi:uncharacterized RDD family membrane protein YckC
VSGVFEGRVPSLRVYVAGLSSKETAMIILGIILLLIGFLLNIPILWTIGVVLLVIGLILFVLGSTGRAVGGRRHWY